MINVRSSTGALALVAVCALPLGLVACGDSDDSDSSAGRDAQAETVSTGVKDEGSKVGSGDDKAAIREEMKALQAAFYAGDGKTWCARVSERAMAETARTQGPGGTCEAAVRQFVPEPVPAAKVKEFRSRIAKIDVDGDRATVTVRQSKRPPQKMPFVRQDGEWKLDAGLVVA